MHFSLIEPYKQRNRLLAGPMYIMHWFFLVFEGVAS